MFIFLIVTIHLIFQAFELPYGPVEFAIGYDTRKEKAKYDASQLALYSLALRGSQTRSTSGYFDVDSQYIELAMRALHSAFGLDQK